MRTPLIRETDRSTGRPITRQRATRGRALARLSPTHFPILLLALYGLLMGVAPAQDPIDLRLLRTGNLEQRYSAVGRLSSATASPEVISALIGALKDPEPTVREAAAAALGRVRQPPAAIASGLESVLDDPEVGVVDAALRALGELRARAAPAAPSVRRKLSHEDHEIRHSAILTLAAMSRVALPAAEGLVEALQDRDARNRSAAAYSLGLLHMGGQWPLGFKAAAGVQKLSELLSDPDRVVREQSIQALGMSGDEAEPALPRLVGFLRNNEESTRVFAARSLGFNGSSASYVVEGLTQALGDDSGAVRDAARVALERIRRLSPGPR